MDDEDAEEGEIASKEIEGAKAKMESDKKEAEI